MPDRNRLLVEGWRFSPTSLAVLNQCQCLELARRTVRFHGLAQESGVRIMSIEPGSPAGRAELLSGDVIVALDDEPVAAIDALHRRLTAERVGRPCRLTILRRTDKRTHEIVPSERR